MVRPHRLRVIKDMPTCNYFKPQGIGLKELKVIVLSLDEYETLRLKDYENLSEIIAAKKMEISQPTFNRLYVKAKQKLVKSIIEGLAIKIEGGNIKMPNRDGTGPKGNGPNTGRGLGNCENKDSKEQNNSVCNSRKRCCQKQRNSNRQNN